MESKSNKILICTPLEGIAKVRERLESLSEIIYEPDIDIDFFENNNQDNVVGIFTNPNRSKIFFSDNVLGKLKNLKFICTASTGTVHIDLDAAKKKNIKIISLKNETDFLSKVTSTAELAFTLMLMSIRNVNKAAIDVQEGKWDCENFVGKQVNDLKIGILGLGRLGKIFASYCNAFDATPLFYDPFVDHCDHLDVKKVSNLNHFLSNIDVLSIHIHANKENHKFINEDFLDKCKENILIINTSRGEVVDEKHLIRFLEKNPCSFYATDVIYDEIESRFNSPIYDSFKKLYPDGNIFITPHIGGMSDGARRLAYNKSVDLLEEFLGGEKNV